jgi:hypothetical protein
MRLGQLARRYDISNQEVNSYIKKIDPNSPTLHPNAKLNEQLEAQLIAYYDDFLGAPDKKVELVEETQDTDATVSATEDEFELPAQDQTSEAESNVEPIDVTSAEQTDEVESAPEKQRETIETDRLLELLESEDEELDLSSFTHIKVPKKELSGLKVVGKIEIEEPKKKAPKEDDTTEESEYQQDRRKRREKRALSEEEREKRRLIAKRKKEEYEARQERKRLEKEEQKRKAARKARYEKRLAKAAAVKKVKNASTKSEIVTSEVYLPETKKPKTIFGRFWKWLNSY